MPPHLPAQGDDLRRHFRVRAGVLAAASNDCRSTVLPSPVQTPVCFLTALPLGIVLRGRFAVVDPVGLRLGVTSLLSVLSRRLLPTDLAVGRVASCTAAFRLLRRATFLARRLRPTRLRLVPLARLLRPTGRAALGRRLGLAVTSRGALFQLRTPVAGLVVPGLATFCVVGLGPRWLPLAPIPRW